MRLLQDWHNWSDCEDRGPAARSWNRRWRNSAQYCFTDHWKVKSSVEEVAALFLDTPSLGEWWPQLGSITMHEPGGRHGASRAFTAQARGFLPYALDLQFRVVNVQFPRQFSVELTGDLRGEGGGILRQDGPNVGIEMRLKIRLTRPPRRGCSR